MLNDLISRQAAIEALKGMAVPLYKDPACEDIWERDRTLDNAIDAIRGLPSAQPERKKGKWIYDGDCYICDQCKSAFDWWADSQTSNYCPNCGADMRGEQNE